MFSYVSTNFVVPDEFDSVDISQEDIEEVNEIAYQANELVDLFYSNIFLSVYRTKREKILKHRAIYQEMCKTVLEKIEFFTGDLDEIADKNSYTNFDYIVTSFFSFVSEFYSVILKYKDIPYLNTDVFFRMKTEEMHRAMRERDNLGVLERMSLEQISVLFKNIIRIYNRF